MKKIYIVIAGAFLIILIITSMLLSLGKKTTSNTQTGSPFPTGVSVQGNTVLPNITPPPNSTLSTIESVETLDFKAAYVPALNKIVVEKKTSSAEESFRQWVDQSRLNQVIGDKNKILFTDEKIIPTPSDSIHKLENKVIGFFQLIDDLNNIGKGTSSNQPATAISPTPLPGLGQGKSPTPNNLNPQKNNLQSKVYYAQCGEFGETPLPDGCTLCNAGCGPTAVAMIASSYLGSKYNPKTIVNLYDTNGYVLGCDGSRYQEAHELLKSLGLKTTDYLVFDAERSEAVIPDLKKYLNSGWTFFTLASFCEEGCGHYFWITDIDAKGNIWAYDPAYGRYEIPYNENSRYPFPLYRLAFGVKK
ncbi:MAG: C39 family peptidase [Patescibacteria group bacterium]|jgi:hypothetical protein